MLNKRLYIFQQFYLSLHLYFRQYLIIKWLKCESHTLIKVTFSSTIFTILNSFYFYIRNVVIFLLFLDTFETKLPPQIQQQLMQDLVYMATDGSFMTPPLVLQL